MDINIKYDINEVAEEIREKIQTELSERFRVELRELSNELKGLFNEQSRSIINALDIADPRQRERLRKALVSGIDKWTKGVLKNG